MKIYYNFVIEGNAFSYYKTATHVNGSANDTLKKIEYILTHYKDLTYKGNERDVGLKLKGFAATVVAQYHVRESKIHWLIRIIFCFCIARRHRQIAGTQARIKALTDPSPPPPPSPRPKPKPSEDYRPVFGETPPPPPPPSPPKPKRFTFPFDRNRDSMRHMLVYLDYRAISNFCAGNKHTNALTEPFRKKIEWSARGCIAQLKMTRPELRPENLFQAARRGDVQQLFGLLLLGTNPNTHRDEHGDQALHWTAYNGDVAATTILLKHKAQVDQPGNLGETPLLQAYHRNRNRLAIMKHLLEKGANPNQREDLQPVLHKAMEDGRVDVVELLLAANADPQLLDGQGNAALHIAVLLGDIALARLIVETNRAPIDQPTEDDIGQTPLFCAYFSLRDPIIRKDMMRFLLESRANPNATNLARETLTAHIAYKAERDLLELLIDYGADINREHLNFTPLGYACGGMINPNTPHVPSVPFINFLLEIGFS